MEGVLRETLERWFTPGFLRSGRPTGARVRAADAARARPRCFADGWRAIGGHDALERLVRSPCRPRARGQRRRGLGAIAHARDRGARSGARFVELDGPHMMHLEHPLELGAAIVEHLRWVEEASGSSRKGS